MLVRRGAARFATVCALLAGLVMVGAAPAFADDEDTVRLGSPSSFTAGGSAGSITVAVTKRTRGCVSARTTLLIQLPGLSAGDVDLMVARDGRWQSVPVSAAGDDVVRTGRVAPEKPELCERKSVSVRYRLGFAAGAPAGRLNIVAEAYTAGGDLIARDAETRKLNGAKGTPTPTGRASKSASPTPTPEETTFAPESDDTEVAPTGQPGLGAGAGNSGGGGVGSMVMVVGVGMVVIGIALLVLLLRRARGGRDERAAVAGAPGAGPRPPFPPAGSGGDATVVMPRIRP